MPSKRMKSKNVRRRQTNQTVPFGVSAVPFSPSVSVFRMNLEVFIGKVTTTVTSGVIATTYAVQAGMVNNFAARFGVFDEYLIEKFLLRINTCSSNLSGLMNFWFEPQVGSTGTPAAADAKNNKTLTFAAGENGHTKTLPYNPRNAATQVWTIITTTNASIGNLKCYTNNADFGSAIAVTDYAVLTGIMTVAFRGFG